MPHITAAMQLSRRRGVSDIVFDSLVGRGSITGDVDSVKNTFSSWDNCMAKSYCKWPVIIGIVVVGLIILSIVSCIIRCACCGMSCCCTCFSFLKCCDCCGGCCDGKKDKPMKHLDDPYAPPRQGFQNQGYQAPAPMMGGRLGGKPGPPQYAQFEVGKSGLAVEPKAALSEDALPPMPSWETASKRHVLNEEEKNAVELGELDPTTGQKVPLMTNAASPAIGGSPSPVHDMNISPYGSRPGQGVGGNGYMGVASEAYGEPNSFNNGYRGSPSPGPGRGMGGPARGYGPGPMALDGQGRGGYPPSSHDQYANDGFSGAAVGYGRSQPQRQNSNDTYGSRQYPPQPQRQYSDGSARPLNPGRQYSDRPYQSNNFQSNSPPPRGPSRGPGGPGRMASPPLNNNSGFDFGTAGQPPFSRPSPPPQQGSQQSFNPYPEQATKSSPPLRQGGYFGGSTAPPSYASRSPPPQEPSYPGYKPYQPPNQGGRAPQALQPGGGRREPQNWDPVQR